MPEGHKAKRRASVGTALPCLAWLAQLLRVGSRENQQNQTLPRVAQMPVHRPPPAQEAPKATGSGEAAERLSPRRPVPQPCPSPLHPRGQWWRAALASRSLLSQSPPPSGGLGLEGAALGPFPMPPPTPSIQPRAWGKGAPNGTPKVLQLLLRRRPQGRGEGPCGAYAAAVEGQLEERRRAVRPHQVAEGGHVEPKVLR